MVMLLPVACYMIYPAMPPRYVDAIRCCVMMLYVVTAAFLPVALLRVVRARLAAALPLLLPRVAAARCRYRSPPRSGTRVAIFCAFFYVTW